MNPTNIEDLHSLPILESAWRTSLEFIGNFTETADGVAYLNHPFGKDDPPWTNPPIGSLVSITIRLMDRDTAFHLHGEVTQYSSDEHGVRGVVLRLLPEERPRQEMVVGCAEGEAFPYVRRRHERVACFFPISVKCKNLPQFDAVANDISEGGMFVATDRLLDRGAVVELQLYLPDRPSALVLQARVVFCATTGPQKGIGVEFQFRTEAERQEVAEQVRFLKSILQQEQSKRSSNPLLQKVETFKALNGKVRAGMADNNERQQWRDLKQAYLEYQESMNGRRRRFQRQPVSFRARVGDEKSFREARALDLSAGGIRLIVPGSYRIGEAMSLVLYVAEEPNPHSIFGRVVWTGGGGLMGLEFLDLDAETQDRIDAWVWSQVDLIALVGRR
ncbi:MAG: hypothetical protein A2341_28500 [Deltaproteobacteria bacterium RIFOXYB12_FULL_58_9]|nr:MAG: hypothetical protein A2341_28500 [Deltaproteobacteria bacterium RIFOXYB12_FULL_58_9]